MDLTQPGAFASAASDLNLDCPCCYRPGLPFIANAADGRLAKMTASHKLSALRVLMAENDLDAYLVFSEDAHGSEYVGKCDERRSYLTGFTGSAGVALVTAKTAQCWTDSRYFLQAADQLPKEWTLMRLYEPGVPSVEDELFARLGGKRVGYDPETFPRSKGQHWRDGWIRKASSSASASAWASGEDAVAPPPAVAPSAPARNGDGSDDDGAAATRQPAVSGVPVPVLVSVAPNLIDRIWRTRPPVPQNPISVHPPHLAGESVPSKLGRVRGALRTESNADGTVLSALDQIAWMFNLRGGDVECNPVFFSYAIVSQTDARLFVGRRGDGLDWVDDDVLSHLDASGVQLRPYAEFGTSAIESMFPAGGRVLLERGSCSVAVYDAVSSSTNCVPVETDGVGPGPVESFKARKNEAEVGGIRECALRDSAALVEFAAWLEEQMGTEVGEREDMRESALADALLTHRRRKHNFVQNSFDTISSVGPNSSVVHYIAVSGSENERILTPDDVYLLDSGGQYLDGTTDVTRTYHFGTPTPKQRRYYTRVLQGHISLARATFPAGTPGLVLDALARSPLWRDGMTYGHGTGHGIGAYLNVHEGPMGIGGGNQPGNVVRKNPRMQAYYLEPVVEGMYMSNEPGYYVDGTYGFRIESDMIAVPAYDLDLDLDDGGCRGGGDGGGGVDDGGEGGGGGDGTEGEGGGDDDCSPAPSKFLRFETVTKVPMCRSLCDASLLTADELGWLNDYHAECREVLTPLLRGDARALAWLEAETAAL